jgi:hypothetical protein
MVERLALTQRQRGFDSLRIHDFSRVGVRVPRSGCYPEGCRFESCLWSPSGQHEDIRGGSSMVEPEAAKLGTGVRFPFTAP